jgi:hypothetical protein
MVRAWVIQLRGPFDMDNLFMIITTSYPEKFPFTKAGDLRIFGLALNNQSDSGESKFKNKTNDERFIFIS